MLKKLKMLSFLLYNFTLNYLEYTHELQWKYFKVRLKLVSSPLKFKKHRQIGKTLLHDSLLNSNLGTAFNILKYSRM